MYILNVIVQITSTLNAVVHITYNDNYVNDVLSPTINTSNNEVHTYTTKQKHQVHVINSNINIYSKGIGNISACI